MATITLTYDARNVSAKKAIDFLMSLGLFHYAEKTTKAKESSYNEDFVNELLESRKSKGIKIKDEDL
jgi:hypothetical protein